jgi:hypothetical protein
MTSSVADPPSPAVASYGTVTPFGAPHTDDRMSEEPLVEKVNVAR